VAAKQPRNADPRRRRVVLNEQGGHRCAAQHIVADHGTGKLVEARICRWDQIDGERVVVFGKLHIAPKSWLSR